MLSKPPEPSKYLQFPVRNCRRKRIPSEPNRSCPSGPSSSWETSLEITRIPLCVIGSHCHLYSWVGFKSFPESECPPGPSRRHCGWAPSPFLRSQRRPWWMKLASMLCQNVQTTWQSVHVEALWWFMMFRKTYGRFLCTHTQRLATDYTPKNGFVSDFSWYTIGLLIILLQSSSLFESLSSYATVSHQEYPVICQTLWTYRPNHLGIKDVIPNRCFTPSRKAMSIQFHFLESLVRILWKLCNLCTLRKKASKKTIKNIGIFATPNRNPWRDQPPAEPSLKLPGITNITVFGLKAPSFFPQKSKILEKSNVDHTVVVVLEMFIY